MPTILSPQPEGGERMAEAAVASTPGAWNKRTVSTSTLDARELNIGCYRMLIVRREHHVELATDDGRSLNLSDLDTRQFVTELRSIANWLDEPKREPKF